MKFEVRYYWYFSFTLFMTQRRQERNYWLNDGHASHFTCWSPISVWQVPGSELACLIWASEPELWLRLRLHQSQVSVTSEYHSHPPISHNQLNFFLSTTKPPVNLRFATSLVRRTWQLNVTTKLTLFILETFIITINHC